MAPKRKAAQKPAAKPSAEDVPLVADDVPPVAIEDMSHITVRRPLKKGKRDIGVRLLSIILSDCRKKQNILILSVSVIFLFVFFVFGLTP